MNYRHDHAKACVLIILMLSAAAITAEASVKNTGKYPGNSFVDPSVIIDADTFSIGSESYVAPFTELRGEYISIGSYSDIQDSVTGSGNIKIADDAVIAHGADLIGNVNIGSEAFIGFNAVITDSTIGDGAYINTGSSVSGVNIPSGKSVPAGAIIDSQDDVEKLKSVTKAQIVFVEDVIGVNRVLAIGYNELFEKKGMETFGKLGPYGNRDIIMHGRYILGHSSNSDPVIGKGSSIDKARIIGEVNLGNNVRVEDGTSIRADEGLPINIGDNAVIGKNNTFHSLNKKIIEIGKDFMIGKDNVIHGPLELGDNVNVGNRSVVFKSRIGNNVKIGDNSIVSGVRLLDGAIIPSGTIVDNQQIANKYNKNLERDIRTEPAWIFKFIGSIFS